MLRSLFAQLAQKANIMASVKILDKKGKAGKETINLDGIFDIEPNTHLLYLAENLQLSNARAGTAHVKSRREVRGGGAKPWRQKGTGRARAGSRTSPLWKGGGVMHGPRATGTFKGVNWTKSMNQKSKIRAILSALNLGIKEGAVSVIPELDIKEGKTKELAAVSANISSTKELVLFIESSESENYKLVVRAASNLPRVKLISEKELNVHDLLKAGQIIFTQAAFDATTQRLESKIAVKAEAK